METLKLSDKAGKPIGSLTFDPCAPGLSDRFDTLKEKVDQIVAPLAHVNTKPDGTGRGTRDAAIVELAEVRLYEAIDDYLSPVNSSADLFKVRRPFASVRGRFYCFWVIGKIRDFIPAQQ